MNKKGSYEAIARALQHKAPSRVDVEEREIAPKVTFATSEGPFMTRLDEKIWGSEEILVPHEAKPLLRELLEDGEAPGLGLTFDWSPEVRKGPIEVARVVGGPVFGRDKDAVIGAFATPSGEAVHHMVRWNDQQAAHQYGGHGARQEVRIIRATKYHFPLLPEKDNHVDATDNAEVVVDMGEVVDTLPADDFR